MPSTNITLVPGAAGLASFWDPIRERLPSDWQQRSLDLPGFGPVPARPDISSYEQLVDHIASGITLPSVVAGQSMGGYMSLQLALRHPALVTHLVLIVATGGVDMARHGAVDWRSLDRTNTANPAWIRAPLPDLTSELGRIQIPVLLLWATRDLLSPLGVARQLEADLPNARLICFDTDDHWMARRFASETALAIRDFVAGQPRAR
ncbi:MAG TPA: alpha/beta hydrolase [Polyangiaceae bacterium]|nr:alpha/beta hydrolase [Polyangiaceae bacterium]